MLSASGRLALRRLIGRWVPHDDWGACESCRRPWWTVRGRIGVQVYYAPLSSMFAMCRGCWDDATPARRLAAYLLLVDRWAEQGDQASPREPSLEVIRERLRTALVVERDALHFRDGPTVVRRPVIGAPPRWWWSRR